MPMWEGMGIQPEGYQNHTEAPSTGLAAVDFWGRVVSGGPT